MILSKNAVAVPFMAATFVVTLFVLQHSAGIGELWKKPWGAVDAPAHADGVALGENSASAAACCESSKAACAESKSACCSESATATCCEPDAASACCKESAEPSGKDACCAGEASDDQASAPSTEDLLASALQLSVEKTVEGLSPRIESAVFEYDPDKRLGVNPNCLNHLSKIRFESGEIAERADLRNERVVSRPVSKTLSCYGEVRYDETRYALLSPLADGVVKDVQVDLGDRVRKGDVLAVVTSPAFGRAKADFLRASAQVRRWEWLTESYSEGAASGAVAKREIVEAGIELDAARIELAVAKQALRNYGLVDRRIEEIRETRDADPGLEVTAPFDAVVVARKAVQGESVEVGRPLFEIADLSRMWLILNVFAEDLNELSLGMPVAFRPEGEKGEVLEGEITWIDAKLDETTRTASVRAELENPEGRLRQGLFGTGLIGVHRDEAMTVAPREAVQWDGCCNVVFVQTVDGGYEPRKVRLGDPVEEGYVVLAGISPGEEVATTGSFLLKTEILKNRIGAGCCGND